MFRHGPADVTSEAPLRSFRRRPALAGNGRHLAIHKAPKLGPENF
jgi:hypothetical protein